MKLSVSHESGWKTPLVLVDGQQVEGVSEIRFTKSGFVAVSTDGRVLAREGQLATLEKAQAEERVRDDILRYFNRVEDATE